MVHLQSKNGLLISVLTTLCFFALVYSTSSEVLSPVSVEGLLLSEKENVHTLKFKVTNNGAAALTLEEFTLPWVEETRFLLLLAVTPDGTEISPYLPEVGMPMAGPVTLKVGESVEGNLSLNKKFPTFAQEIKRHDIILFWSAQLLTREHAKLPRVGGWLLVPKAVGKKFN